MSYPVSFDPLIPASFLDRSALVYPHKTAVIYDETRRSYGELGARVNRLAAALERTGVGRGDRVAYLAPNVPAMLEAKFGPQRIGAVIVPLNIRLAAREIAYVLNHSGARTLVFDSEWAATVRGAIAEGIGVETFVQVIDQAPRADDVSGPEYEAFLADAPEAPANPVKIDERDTISINYTSGTTGFPKGVEYHARGAYLNAMGEAIEMGLQPGSVYLWTVPMFHCNGWCFPWGVTAVGATHVCLRKVVPAEIFRLIREHGVTHMCCAPTVLTSLYSAPDAPEKALDGVTIATGGAPPAPQVIRSIEAMGARLRHLYGLTETYGPHTICADQPEWAELEFGEIARLKSRQGVPYVMTGDNLRVVDSEMNELAWDGEALGEVVMRGNNVMTGYYRDPDATEEAFVGGWFHSGDLGVRHPDGYIELKDRSKDIIISGGENISNQEVEKVLMEHPAVLEVSVIGVPDEKWGEVPKAFVTPRNGQALTPEELIAFARERLAHFKAPKSVEFGELPKTATGKIQKFVLREREWGGREKRIQG